MSKSTKASRNGNGKKEKESFDNFFSRIFGKDRWLHSLQPSMSSDAPKVALINRYSKLEIEPMLERKVKMMQSGLSQAALMRALACGTAPERVVQFAEQQGDEQKQKPDSCSDNGKSNDDVDDGESQQKNASQRETPFYESLPPLQEYRLNSGIRYVAPPQDGIEKYKNFEFPAVKRDERSVPGCYLLDLCSLLAVDALHAEPFHKVCDMCAAPGGKSCAIGQIVVAPGELVSNEPDGSRRSRLQRVLHEYLGPNVPFKVAARDATTWYQPDYFDRVLVDAPCGSERHLIHQHQTSTWSNEGATARNKTQTSLLMRAFETVKVGGRVVYSTCSIHPSENDGVVFAALEKTRNNIQVDSNIFVKKLLLLVQPGDGVSGDGASVKDSFDLYSKGEVQACGGILLLPDKCHGHGPMFICAFTRLEGKKVADLTSDEDEDDDADDE